MSSRRLNQDRLSRSTLRGAKDALGAKREEGRGKRNHRGHREHRGGAGGTSVQLSEFCVQWAPKAPIVILIVIVIERSDPVPAKSEQTVGGGLSPDKGAVGAKWKVESRGKLALRPRATILRNATQGTT